jgi:predicted component of type VI protein secretion system
LLAALLVSTVLVSGISGCSGQNSNFTPPGTYNLQVTATSSQSQQAHSVTIPLTVTR